MKRFVAILFKLGIMFFLLPSLFPVFAQCPEGYENLCKITVQDNPNFTGNIVQILIVIAIVLSTIFLILGSIRWIMSGGDKGKVDQARAAVTAAIVGLVISFLAYFIVTLVVYMLTGSGDLGHVLKIPKLLD